MAVLTGEKGTVKVDTNDSAGTTTAVADVRSWTITHTADTVETTSMDSGGVRTYAKGLAQFTGSMEVVYNDDHLSTNGSVFNPEDSQDGTITIEFFTSTDTGAKKYSGEVLVTSVARTSSYDDLITATVDFQGSGSLTEAAVA
jgi:predicted secreted protein